MRRRWIYLAFLAACTPSSPSQEEAPPAAIRRLTQDLREAGIPTRAERLRSLREFPGCQEAELRYRLRFEGDFVNVSRFRSHGQAEHCLGEFRNTVLKAGKKAWEQMRGDITTHGPWLFFFPPEHEGDDLREEVLAILRRAETGPQK